MYHATLDDLYLIPTAEVPVTNIYRDVILNESELPIKNTAYSACFRREAGSYGKDVRGLNRLHQFDKVRLFASILLSILMNHWEMVDYVQSLVEKLELPWRIFAFMWAIWVSLRPSRSTSRYILQHKNVGWKWSSVSNFESYQANRLKCRYRDASKKTQLCHTLNGSALALPRIVAALLENNQTPSRGYPYAKSIGTLHRFRYD